MESSHRFEVVTFVGDMGNSERADGQEFLHTAGGTTGY